MKTLKKMLLWALAFICVVLAGCADLQIQVDRALRYDQCRRMGYSIEECRESIERRYRPPQSLRPPVVRPEPPASPTPPIDVEESLVINTPSGDVVVYNFFIDKETKIYGETKDSGGVILRGTKEYAVFYSFTDQSFLITLMRNPKYAREKGERFLLQKLRVAPETLCRLSVCVQVMGGTRSHPNADFDYGLSFCPGSVPIR